jgi:protein-S-isoprenylcysteine O-methyltransferase Ste14
LIVFYYFWQPITEIYYFSFENTIFEKLFIIVSIYGYIQIFMVVPMMIKTDVCGFRRMILVIKNDEIEYPYKDIISEHLIYKFCRHPMQGSLFIFHLFTSPILNLGRILISIIFIVGSIFGVVHEESILRKDEGYVRYAKIVKNMYYPNFYDMIKYVLGNENSVNPAKLN